MTKQECMLSAQLNRLKMEIKLKRITQKELSSATGVHQSQISRILSGQVKLLSKNVIVLCKYLDILHISSAATRPFPPVLLNALEQIWNGTDEHAKAISQVILSLNGMEVKRPLN